ncbi:MAG: hypothetical protein K8S87_06335, partial [Planctomycetes bacterium]|nr:hypothetical protein [Planctomycetota bacterium]
TTLRQRFSSDRQDACPTILSNTGNFLYKPDRFGEICKGTEKKACLHACHTIFATKPYNSEKYAKVTQKTHVYLP